jgi:hypothetical protein
MVRAMKIKTAKTIKDYTVNFRGTEITVPAGSIVNNQTSCGPSDNYRFWHDFEKVAEQITGFKKSSLYFDLMHYGINVPAEFCESY